MTIDGAISGSRFADEVLQAARGLAWRFTDIALAQVLILVPCGIGWIAVIGDPDNASFEWIARVHGADDSGPAPLERSDCGWGGTLVALRDALNRLEQYL